MARSIIKSCIIISLICFSSSSLKAQDLTLDYSLTAEEIAQNLVGEGVDIFNAQIIAADSSYAFYQTTDTEIGSSEGVLLSTGRAWNAIGPNDETGLPDLDGQDCLRDRSGGRTRSAGPRGAVLRAGDARLRGLPAVGS